eukprot:3645789-Pleurochrysis_carterae.AAC.2
MAFGATPHASIRLNSAVARLSWPPFAHASMRVVKVTTFGESRRRSISARMAKPRSNCPARPHALISAE